MKSVVITGSARGFGLEMAKCFRKNNYHVMLSDLKEESLIEAKNKVEEVKGEGRVYYKVCDVTKFEDLEELFKYSKEVFDSVDIWINNAGVNQPEKAIYELNKKEIDFVLDVDLHGAIYGSSVAFKYMNEQGHGYIYNIEGYGSNDAMMLGLSIYGTSKRAITYFTRALAKESKTLNSKVCVGRIAPGIMITDFITKDGEITLKEKTKKVYNILGDYPETIAEYVVNKMVKNTKNDVQFTWLTNFRAFTRFLLAGFKKRDFFK